MRREQRSTNSPLNSFSCLKLQQTQALIQPRDWQLCVFPAGVPVKPDGVLHTSSSPSSASMTTTRTPTAADPEPPSPPRNHITVAKKQSWARQGSAAPLTNLSSSSAPRASDQERPSGISQDASGQAWNHRLAQDEVQGWQFNSFPI